MCYFSVLFLFSIFFFFKFVDDIYYVDLVCVFNKKQKIKNKTSTNNKLENNTFHLIFSVRLRIRDDGTFVAKFNKDKMNIEEIEIETNKNKSERRKTK